jgi:hypothetical protein
VLSADSVCSVMLLEAAHTSDPSFDPAMVLFKPIIQVDARPVVNVAAQRRADCARVGAMPVGVTRSGTKPTTDRAERKNLWPLSCHGSRSASYRSGSRCDRSAETNSTGRTCSVGPATENSHRHRGAGLASTVATPRELHFSLVDGKSDTLWRIYNAWQRSVATDRTSLAQNPTSEAPRRAEANGSHD